MAVGSGEQSRTATAVCERFAERSLLLLDGTIQIMMPPGRRCCRSRGLSGRNVGWIASRRSAGTATTGEFAKHDACVRVSFHAF